MRTSRRWQRASFIVAFVAVSLLIVMASVQAMTPAATRIENRAQATYPWDGELQTTWSNWVSVTVSQVAAVNVMPKSSGGPPVQADFVPAYDLAVTPGQRVLLPYRTLNTGNGTDTFILDISIYANDGTLSAEAFDPILYHDLSGDGFVDPGDPVIDRITIAAGESAAVILSLRISPLAMDEEPIYAGITATSLSEPSVHESNTWSRLTISPDIPIIRATRSVEHQRGPMWPSDAPAANGATGSVNAETGDHLTHTIILDNMGYVAGTDIVMWELLDPSEVLVQDAYGAGYPLRVSGTPTALGTTPDARARLVTDSDGRQGIQLHIPKMDSTQRVIVEYKVAVDWQPNDYEFSKTAEVTYDERPGQTRLVKSNTLVVLRGQEIALRIIPKGGSLLPGALNTQHWPEAIAGQRLTFEARVYNTGRTAGVVELTPADLELPEGWTMRFFGSDGVTPLIDTNNNGTVDMGYLALGAHRDVVISVDVPMDPQAFEDPPYTFPIKAYFAMAPNLWDRTFIQVDTVTAVEHVWDPLVLLVDPPNLTTPGSVLTYTLYFANASSVDAFGVQIVEQLSEYLEPPTLVDGELMADADFTDILARSAANTAGISQPVVALSTPVTGVYDPVQHAIVWTIPHVPSRAGGILTFVSEVAPWTPESTVIEVQGVLSSAETTLVAVSNVVTNVVLTDELLIALKSDHQVLTVGDANRFTVEVQNPNPLIAAEDVQVHILLPPGLSYRKGSSRLGTTSIADPMQHSGHLTYTIPRIEKSGTVRLTFQTVVNPAADYELVVEAFAMMETGPDEWSMSPPSSVHLFVIQGILSDRGVIVGRVMLRGESDSPDSVPQGVPGVRVVMDNGQFAVTDMDGRFSFSEVHAGTRLLRLDPLTLSSVELVPGGIDPAQSKTMRVLVPIGGIAMVDFVLSPSELEITSSERIIEEGNDS